MFVFSFASFPIPCRCARFSPLAKPLRKCTRVFRGRRPFSLRLFPRVRRVKRTERRRILRRISVASTRNDYGPDCVPSRGLLTSTSLLTAYSLRARNARTYVPTYGPAVCPRTSHRVAQEGIAYSRRAA